MQFVVLVALAQSILAAPAIVTVTQTEYSAPTNNPKIYASVDWNTVNYNPTTIVAPAAQTAAATQAANRGDLISLESFFSSNFNKLLSLLGFGGSAGSSGTTTTPTTASSAAPVAGSSTSAVVVQSSPVIPAAATSTSSTAVAKSSTSSAASPASSASSTGTSSSDVYAQIYSSSNLDTAFAKDILDAHNNYRALHGVGPLSWDVSAYNYAASNAASYDCSGVLTHTHGPFGENLAAGFSTGSSAVKAWYDEGQTYDYSVANTYDHFTQVVWKGSTKLGCAYKDCTSTGWGKYIICEYSPAGNVIGQNKANVLPLV